MLVMSGQGNASISRFLNFLRPQTQENITKIDLPEPTRSTRDVVIMPIESQAVSRWVSGQPLYLTNMGKWDRIGPMPIRSPQEKWSKGALVNVVV